MFKRKAYEELLKWKKEWDGKYACLLEGARRVGKTTIAEEFARNEYESYILIDFSNISKELLDIFDDITQSVNKNNLTFHSKSLACSTNELNGTITDVSDEYYDNKEEINCDSGGL